jgi:hypothetical protein
MLRALSTPITDSQRHSPKIQARRILRKARSPLDSVESCPEHALNTRDVTSVWTPGGHTQVPVVLMRYRAAKDHLMASVQSNAECSRMDVAYW